MKKLLVPLLFSATLLYGCTSTLHGQSSPSVSQAAQTSVQTVDVTNDPPADADQPTSSAQTKTDGQATAPSTQSAPQPAPAPAPKTAPAPAPKPEPQPAPQPAPTKSNTPSPAPSSGTGANTTSSQPATDPSGRYIRVPNDQIDLAHLVIDCDLTHQLITVTQGDKTVRTMPTSSGLDNIPDNSTPRGTFYVQPERGTWFYSEQYHEGAEYWTSWKDHGVFLFHSVVMDKNHNILQNELQKLGTKASHGCFRLPLEDAKWIYDNIRTGTKVVVHD